ncbi:hypothetical protein OKW45_001263 [Paraburkholderia sp. WSM4175]
MVRSGRIAGFTLLFADDASIRLGTRAIDTADALLREVHRLRPDAFVVYKPHPDVLSGNRNGLIDAQQLADVVDTEADLLSLVDGADEVHALSSLAGFDVLLRYPLAKARATSMVKKQTVQTKEKPRKIEILRGFLSRPALKRYPPTATSYSY